MMQQIDTLPDLMALTKDTPIVILIGPSCAGKNYVASQFTKQDGRDYIIECTTRPIRPYETDGKDAYFKTQEDFLSDVSTGKIFEHRTYNTDLNGVTAVWYYGSLPVNVNDGTRYVTAIGIMGAEKYIRHYGGQNVQVVYLNVPASLRTLRAKNRPGYSEPEWNRRLKADEYDFSENSIAILEDILGKPVLSYENC